LSSKIEFVSTGFNYFYHYQGKKIPSVYLYHLSLNEHTEMNSMNSYIIQPVNYPVRNEFLVCKIKLYSNQNWNKKSWKD